MDCTVRTLRREFGRRASSRWLRTLVLTLAVAVLGATLWAQGEAMPSSTGGAAPATASPPPTASTPSTASTSTQPSFPTELPPERTPLPTGPDKTTVSPSRMLSAVIVVLGLLALTAFGMRKLMPRIARATGKEMAVQESLPLGQGRMLHLVNVGGRKLLISSTKERVTMLADLSGTGVGPVGSSASCGRGQAEETHGQDARATENHGRDAHATHGQDGRATEDSE